MEQVFYIILGAILALAGGIIAQNYQSRIETKKEDRDLLFKALDILIDLEPYFNALPAAHEDVIKPCKKIYAIARRVQTRHYRQLGEKLIEFAQKDVQHTKESLEKIIDEMGTEISKPFDIFHRKEKEFFAKAAEELRNMRGRARNNREREND